MRGRRRVDCIGRMVMRPSDLEIASQSHLKIFESFPIAGTICILGSYSQLRKGAWLQRNFTLSTSQRLNPSTFETRSLPALTRSYPRRFTFYVAHPIRSIQRFSFQLSAFPLVLFVADFFHPIDRFAVQRFLNRDMSHRGRRRSAMPMLFTGRKPDHITGPDFLDRAASALRPTKTGRNDQRLTEWMRMPGGASTRLERDVCATHARRFRGFK